MKKIFILFAILLGMQRWSFAQDPQFTQFYAAPLYLNPSFAGATLHSRGVVNARAQWAGLSKPFVTYAVSADHNFEKIKSGLGFLAYLDKAGSGALASSSISGIYSYKIQMANKWVARPSVQFSYGSRSIDYNKLIFGDQLDLQGATGILTGETFDQSGRVNFFDFSSGLLLHNEKVWLGLSAHHLNRPNEALNGGQSSIPVKTSLHGGIKIDLTNTVYRTHGKSREKSITPAFMYKMQGKFDQLDLGMYYYYDPLVIGAWYRGIPVLKAYQPGYGNNDAVAILLGIRQENFSIGYSYDLTISKLGPTKTNGSHEISLSYIFGGNNGKTNKRPNLRKKDMVIPCPKF
jgi:type IX secretion system PorP/SprF family membrane protein